jgi:hypothetical protein
MERDVVERAIASSPRARLCRASDDGRVYDVEFDVCTLVRDDTGRVYREERRVRVLYELHPQHPLRNPVVFARDIDLYNAHVNDPRAPGPLPPIPLICMGEFQPWMRLADWIEATYDVLRWRRIATDSPLNEEAAAFARQGDPGRFPVDTRPFRPSASSGSRRTDPDASSGSRGGDEGESAPGRAEVLEPEQGLRILGDWSAS